MMNVGCRYELAPKDDHVIVYEVYEVASLCPHASRDSLEHDSFFFTYHSIDISIPVSMSRLM